MCAEGKPARFRRPQGQELQIGASIGASVYPTLTESTTALINAADAAMYEVKRDDGLEYKLADAAAERPA